MPDTVEIKSYKIIDKGYVIFYLENNGSPCGSIDFISGKINFNISCNRLIFKGMERIKELSLEYKDESLVFIFSNKKKLSVNGSTAIFEKMTGHIKTYRDHDDQLIKNSFFNN